MFLRSDLRRRQNPGSVNPSMFFNDLFFYIVIPAGRLLGFIVAFHFLVGLCWIVGMALWSGTYDIMGATLGYITLRRPTGYSIQGVWCYFVFVTIGLIWASSKVALLASGTQKLPDQAYQGDCFRVAAFCGTILYIFGSTTSLTLYVELRKQILIVRREVLDELSEYERIISNEPEIHDAADGEPMEPDQPQNRFPGTPFRVADECKDAPA
eukprot:jgi/Bigna1/133415/aug1.21_g8123